MISLGNAILGNIPASVTAVAGQKRGRGRPRKIVQREGIYIHDKADAKSKCKQLTPKTMYEIRHRYSELNIQYPKAKIAGVVCKIAEEFNLTYRQVYDLVV
jgi:hypothetical protein